MMFRKFFNGKSQSITSAAALIGAASLASRLLGVIRDRVLASEFGVGNTLDAYYAAFRIPDTIFNLIVLGALSAAFIPVFSDLHEAHKEKAWLLANNVLNILVVALGVLCGVLFFTAPWVTAWITPGFSGEKLQLTIMLTRVMLVSPFILGISSLFGGILQTFKRFFVYSLAPIAYNLGIIFGALVLVPLWGIIGLAYGVILGALLHLLVQLPTAEFLGFRYKFIFKPRMLEFVQILKLMVPRTMSLAVSQVNLVILTVIASTLPAGSLTIFNLANNLQNFPIGIFGISFAIAAFPTLCDLSRKDKKDFVDSFSNTLRQILFFIIPVAALFVILRAQIVRVVLGGGLFDWAATTATAQALGFFAVAMVAQSIIPLYVRAFFAYKNSITPFIISIVTEVFNIILALLFTKSFYIYGYHFDMGVLGLPLALSVSSFLQLTLLWAFLRLKLSSLNDLKTLYSLSKIFIATIAMGVVVQAMKFAVEPFFGTETFFGIFGQGLVSGLVGIGVFVLVGYLLKMEELFTTIASLKRRLIKEKKGLGEMEGIEETVE